MKSERESLFRSAVVLVLCSLAACSIFKNNEEAQAVINQRVVGMAAGDFFQTYGPARTRSEQLDGSTAYDWQSSIGKVAAGPVGLDERTCTLRIVADRRGRVATADIVLDNPGRVSTSRCGEMFKAK
ncbi:MAG: hypothetical protein M3R22_00865 [Pseudomonadota bacterium]|nr:hypothetical protein [Pseudomonadota bacterium]